MHKIKIHHPNLSVTAKCRLLSISRSSVYYQAQPKPAAELALLRQIDQYFLDNPCLGSRKMTALLRRDGHSINRKKVQRLMRSLGIQAIYAKPNTSQPHSRHHTYPNSTQSHLQRCHLQMAGFIGLRCGFIAARAASSPAAGPGYQQG